MLYWKKQTLLRRPLPDSKCSKTRNIKASYPLRDCPQRKIQALGYIRALDVFGDTDCEVIKLILDRLRNTAGKVDTNKFDMCEIGTIDFDLLKVGCASRQLDVVAPRWLSLFQLILDIPATIKYRSGVISSEGSGRNIERLQEERCRIGFDIERDAAPDGFLSFRASVEGKVLGSFDGIRSTGLVIIVACGVTIDELPMQSYSVRAKQAGKANAYHESWKVKFL
jgi:hypothetical protein